MVASSPAAQAFVRGQAPASAWTAAVRLGPILSNSAARRAGDFPPRAVAPTSTMESNQSELEALTWSRDWSATPLGPVERWPQSLKTIVDVLLTSRFSMWMGWGPDLLFFYNDAYRRDTLGVKHPWALGRPFREVWSEIWPDLEPRIRSVIVDGAATWDEALLLFLERSGYREETYH